MSCDAALEAIKSPVRMQLVAQLCGAEGSRPGLCHHHTREPRVRDASIDHI